MGLSLEWRFLIQAAIFVAICNTLLTFVFNLINYNPDQKTHIVFQTYLDLLFNQPAILTFFELFKMFFIAGLITFVGRLFSGTGLFISIFAGVVWLHFILALVNVILFGASQLNFLLIGYLVLLTNFWILWALSECAVVAHGFKSTFIVLIVGAIIFLVFITILIQSLNMMGINFFEGTELNV